VPPPVLFETHVGVDLDYEHRLRGRVVTRSPGSCPNRLDGIRFGHGCTRRGGISKCAELAPHG
jgi:hypothetical protein